jgi:hypothetical protein
VRPVVRVRDTSTGRLVKVFTRVRPDDRGTSIVVRVREGWEEMYRMLLPDFNVPSPNPLEPKQRCEGERERECVCVCVFVASAHDFLCLVFALQLGQHTLNPHH